MTAYKSAPSNPDSALWQDILTGLMFPITTSGGATINVQGSTMILSGRLMTGITSVLTEKQFLAYRNWTDITVESVGVYSNCDWTMTLNNSNYAIGVEAEQGIRGTNGITWSNPVGDLSGLRGFQSTITCYPPVSGSYTVAGTSGYKSYLEVRAGVTVTRHQHFEVRAAVSVGGGAIGTEYGLYVPTLTGTTRWGIYNLDRTALGDVLYPATPAGAVQTATGLRGVSGVPSNSDGANGEWCLSDNGHVYFKAGGTWSSKV